MKQSKLLTIILSVVVALFILSLSIAIPIIVRPFYYAHINMYGLEGSTGLTRQEIIAAYDEMMDFCTGVTKEFSTGVLEWSESGKSHFVDVRNLFILDFFVATITSVILAVWLLGRRYIKVRTYRFLGRGPAMWGSVSLITLFVVVGGLAAMNFDKAFVVFHQIFFPGKDNWVFDYDTDQIIRILPQDFFMNCAILILGFIILLSITFIVVDLQKTRNKKGRIKKLEETS